MRNNWFFFYVRNNWFEILNFYSNLVVFAAIKTTSNKKGKKILVTHNQKCKKKIKIKFEGYIHFLIGMKHVYLY